MADRKTVTSLLTPMNFAELSSVLRAPGTTTNVRPADNSCRANWISAPRAGYIRLAVDGSITRLLPRQRVYVGHL